MVGGHHIAHIAHLGGALVGVLLVVLLARLPDPGPTKPSGRTSG
jgi:membrane associated rhomboid family serine protease